MPERRLHEAKVEAGFGFLTMSGQHCGSVTRYPIPHAGLRGRPLMIWGGGGGKIENEFIFSVGMPFVFLEKRLRPYPQIINGCPLKRHCTRDPGGPWNQYTLATNNKQKAKINHYWIEHFRFIDLTQTFIKVTQNNHPRVSFPSVHLIHSLYVPRHHLVTLLTPRKIISS